MKKSAAVSMPVHALASGTMPAPVHLDGHNGSHNGAGHNGGHPAGHNGAVHIGAPATRVANRREALARDPLSAEDILAGFYRPLDQNGQDRQNRQDKAGSPADQAGHVIPELRPIHPLGPAQQPAVSPPAEAVIKPPRSKAKPVHYKIVCISLYVEDIERLDQLVGELKRRGHTKANKSQLIRAALEQIDLDKVPKAR